MFSLNEKQLATLDERQFVNFLHRAVQHLRKFHAHRVATYSDEALSRYVRLCADKAYRQYSLTTEQAIVCYCKLPILLGSDFERDPRCASINALLAKRLFHPSTRAKMALAIAYRLTKSRR